MTFRHIDERIVLYLNINREKYGKKWSNQNKEEKTDVTINIYRAKKEAGDRWQMNGIHTND